MVGRLDSADIAIKSPDLSRQHARLHVSADGVRVEDLGSRNHTFVDGTQVEGSAQAAVGSELRFASVDARLVALDEVKLGEGG